MLSKFACEVGWGDNDGDGYEYDVDKQGRTATLGQATLIAFNLREFHNKQV